MRNTIFQLYCVQLEQNWAITAHMRMRTYLYDVMTTVYPAPWPHCRSGRCCQQVCTAGNILLLPFSLDSTTACDDARQMKHERSIILRTRDFCAILSYTLRQLSIDMLLHTLFIPSADVSCTKANSPTISHSVFARDQCPASGSLPTAVLPSQLCPL